MNKCRGRIFILSGPSGVGKGTLKQRLLCEFAEHLAFSVSATTRQPRPGEVEGVDYFYCDREAFVQKLGCEAFLEHAEYAGNFYGTPKAFVYGLLDRGIDVILEIEVQGARQVMANEPECISIFILPPSLEELEERLRNRGTEDEAKIQRRLSAARKEMSSIDDYDYRILNDDLEKAYPKLREIYLRHAGFMQGCPTATTEER